MERKNQPRLSSTAHTRARARAHTRPLSPRFRKRANPKQTSRLLWLEALLVTCRDRTGQEGRFPQTQPLRRPPAPSLWLGLPVLPAKARRRTGASGHPPCPEGAAVPLGRSLPGPASGRAARCPLFAEELQGSSRAGRNSSSFKGWAVTSSPPWALPPPTPAPAQPRRLPSL